MWHVACAARTSAVAPRDQSRQLAAGIKLLAHMLIILLQKSSQLFSLTDNLLIVNYYASF